VADDASARVAGEDPLDAFGHGFSSIRNRHLPSVKGVADSDSATVMN
jgi:hypothetical protein